MPCPMRFGPEPRISTRGARRRAARRSVVGRVEVRGLGRDLAGAGVDGLEDRPHAEPRAGARTSPRSRRQCGEPRRTRRGAWRAQPSASGREPARHRVVLERHHARELVAEPGWIADSRRARRGLARADARRAARRASPTRACDAAGSRARRVELARAQRLPERLAERAADPHRLADRLHLRRQRRRRRPGTSRTRTAAPSRRRSRSSARTRPASCRVMSFGISSSV